MKNFKRYSEKEKKEMVELYEAFKNYMRAAEKFGCAMSTVYYAANPEKYEKHKEHVYNMKNK